jgi:tetratricopeptide (TPR) repeat protein
VATEIGAREQLRERYSSLKLKIQDPATPGAELSNAYGDMGKLLMAAGEYLDVAESCFLHAQALAPRERRWPYYLGHLYRIEGDPVKSAAFFEKALQLEPEDMATLIWLGEMELAQDRPMAAEPLFAKAMSLQPRSVPARLGLGRAALARKNYGDAVKYLEEALSFGPQGAAVHYPLAMAYRGLGELDKAEAHLRQRDDIPVLPPDPLMEELGELVESSVTYELRGNRALGKGDWAAAAAYFRKGLELAPRSPSLRHELGTALYQMGDTRGAVEQFEAVVRDSPGYIKALYSLGVVMEANGRADEAIERFSAALKSDPGYVEARLRLAVVLRQRGRLRESLSQYEQIIKLDPRLPEGQFEYAIALAALGRFREARDRLTDNVKAHPDQPAFSLALARVLAAAPDDRVRDGRQASAVMEALSDDQRRLDLGETMAMTFAEVGRFEDASAWQRDAITAARRVGRDDLADRMAENLKLYEGRKPCRTPWRSGEWP